MYITCMVLYRYNSHVNEFEAMQYACRSNISEIMTGVSVLRSLYTFSTIERFKMQVTFICLN